MIKYGLFITLLFTIVTAVYIPPGPRYRCPNEVLLLHPCECLADGDDGIRVRCVNANLASMSIGLANLATYGMPVEELHLDQCHISHLYGTLLTQLKIRVLVIENSPITSIDQHFFLGVNRTLNELHIVNTSLSEFPKGAFKPLGNLTLLKIDINMLNSLPKDAFVGGEIVGKLQTLQVTNGNLSAITLETFQHLKKLKKLDLHGNNISKLQKNQFRGLRDTEILDLSFNQLTKIDSSNFADLTKMSWCNLSHNAIADLTRGTFARNAVLRVLNLSHNKIRRLDTNSFRGMRFLRRLYLSDNAITEVGRGTFGGLTRIGVIDLARNLITKVDFQMFYQLNLAELVDLSENNITEIQKLAFKDLYLAKINISHNMLETIEVGAFENCANITVLDLSYNQLQDIPKKAFDENTYATEFRLQFNMLTDMSQVPLQNMAGLKILNVSYNEIVEIPRNTFPKLYELHMIDISHNNLSEIANGVFQTLFSLRHLNLSHNSMETLKPSTFGTLPTLLELDLGYNQLKSVARSALAKLSSARTLKINNNELETLFQIPISVGHVDVSYNKLTNLPDRVWPSMNALLSLNMRGNQLQNNLHKGSFASLLTLRNLDLSENDISEVPWEALSDLSSLQYLLLESNNLTRLNKAAFGRLPVVFELNMANNKIFNISSLAFEGLLQLLTLNLTNNNISYIPTDALKGLVSLRMLDLSFNKLEKIDNKTNSILDDCLSLEKLNLSHNDISFISRRMFPSNPYIPYRLREVDLSYNHMPVLTYDIVFGARKVQVMNFSHNNINDIRKGVIGNLTNLRTLDLSYNELKDLTTDPDIFNLPVNISHLSLSHNKLSTLPLKKITKLSDLKVLDVSGNYLETIDDEVVSMIKDGTEVMIDENPISCDCFLRPLKRYMTQMNYKNPKVMCATPLSLDGRMLHEVPDTWLSCVQNVANDLRLKQNPDLYDVTSDLKFRNVQFSKTTISLRWYVTKVEDIADFYVFVRDKTTTDTKNIVWEMDLPYDARKININIAQNEDLLKAVQTGTKNLQVCVLARDSNANTRGWYKNQCHDIPNDLKSISGVQALNVRISLVYYCIFVSFVQYFFVI